MPSKEKKWGPTVKYGFIVILTPYKKLVGSRKAIFPIQRFFFASKTQASAFQLTQG